jgi:hypothetical protein
MFGRGGFCKDWRGVADSGRSSDSSQWSVWNEPICLTGFFVVNSFVSFQENAHHERQMASFGIFLIRGRCRAFLCSVSETAHKCTVFSISFVEINGFINFLSRIFARFRPPRCPAPDFRRYSGELNLDCILPFLPIRREPLFTQSLAHRFEAKASINEGEALESIF